MPLPESSSPNAGRSPPCGEDAGPRALAERLRSAVALHQAGQLDRAESTYRAIVDSDPRHADALHLLGLIALGRNDAPRAIDWIARAVAADPHRALYHCNLGAACRASGRLEQAIDAFRRAIELEPSLAGAHYNLGLAFEAVGDGAAAAARLRDAISVDPRFADAWNALGRVLASRGQPDEAIDCFRRALAAQPRFADAHYNLGNALSRMARHEEAVAAYCRALALSRRRDPARICNNLGNSLQALDRHDAAVRAFRRALAADPGFAEAHNNLGAALHRAGDLDGAEAAYRHALAASGGPATDRCPLERVHINLGNLFGDRGMLDAALASYDEALRLDPICPEARFNRALTLLRSGNFAEGWPEYEWRFDHKVARRDFVEPVWDGSPLAGRRLLVYAEQGIGDEIMFAGCLPDLKSFADAQSAPTESDVTADGAPRAAAPGNRTGESGCVVVECESRLAPLFARSFTWARVVARPVQTGSSGRVDLPIDVQIAMGGLPGLFRNRESDFPGRQSAGGAVARRDGYLNADASRSAYWKSRLARLGPSPVAGVSWRGGMDPVLKRRRSTSPSDWAALRSLSGVTWLDVQYGSTSDERADFLRCGPALQHVDGADAIGNLDEFAALIAACDLVVSVDNSTAHLAGALGTPVWTLLPFASDWRWCEERTDSPWYPTMRLYRQPAAGDWREVFSRVAGDLARILAEGNSR